MRGPWTRWRWRPSSSFPMPDANGGSRVGAAPSGLGAWVLYDVGSSAYLLLVPAVGFSVYFRSYVVPDPALADGLWGVAVALPLLVAGLLAPLAGAVFDQVGDRRVPLACLTVTCCLATASLWTLRPGDVVQAMVLFGVAQLAYILAF